MASSTADTPNLRVRLAWFAAVLVSGALALSSVALSILLIASIWNDTEVDPVFLVPACVPLTVVACVGAWAAVKRRWLLASVGALATAPLAVLSGGFGTPAIIAGYALLLASVHFLAER